MSILISVIIPTYNSGDKVVATLDSIAMQERDLWECIVVDGESHDDTMDHVHARSFVRSKSEPDRGIYDAMNKGIAVAKGDWLYFLGAGDLVSTDVFTEIVPILSKLVGPAVVYGKVARADSAVEIGHRATPLRLCYGENIPHQAIFYHRSVFDLLGSYSLDYPILADFEFNLRCFSDPRISTLFVDRIVAEYEGGGKSDTHRDQAFFRDYPGMIRRHFGTYWYIVYKIRHFGGKMRGGFASR